MTDTSKREDMIRVASKRLYFDHSTDKIAETAPEIMALCEQFAEVTLTVFEQAHAPSDDEMEALVREVSLAHAEAWSDERECAEAPDRIADAILAAGFRRTAVQEPSDEPTVRDHVRCLTGATDAELDELGGFQAEPSDAQVDAAYLAWNGARIEGGHTGFTAMRAALHAAYEEGKKR